MNGQPTTPQVVYAPANGAQVVVLAQADGSAPTIVYTNGAPVMYVQAPAVQAAPAQPPQQPQSANPHTRKLDNSTGFVDYTLGAIYLPVAAAQVASHIGVSYWLALLFFSALRLTAFISFLSAWSDNVVLWIVIIPAEITLFVFGPLAAGCIGFFITLYGSMGGNDSAVVTALMYIMCVVVFALSVWFMRATMRAQGAFTRGSKIIDALVALSFPYWSVMEMLVLARVRSVMPSFMLGPLIKESNGNEYASA